METRAPFVIVGAFVLAAIVAVFGFVYWLQNAGGLGPRATYHVQFEGSVPGLLVGAAVLFNGIRVGEVTSLRLDSSNPQFVMATIAVDAVTHTAYALALEYGPPPAGAPAPAAGRGPARGPVTGAWLFVITH